MIGPIVMIRVLILLFSCLLIIVSLDAITRFDEQLHFERIEETASSLLGIEDKRSTNLHSLNASSQNVDKTFKKKAAALSRLLKIHIDYLRNDTDQVELVFLVDASGSVGSKNFQSELNFVKNLLSDFSVEPSATRVAIVTFGGKRNVKRNVDQISRVNEIDNKCYLLNRQLSNINYTGGGTYTKGALLEAFRILEKGRSDAKKAVFLITDGFSNGGDPRPAANLLKDAGATIFTFGIRTGNVDELHDIASFPGYTHSYFLNSFTEFEAFVRRALHRDLKAGKYVPVTVPDNCNLLCRNISEVGSEWNCCDNFATCACGTATGHYSCICPTGYFGSGLNGSCHPCPNGTYASGEISGDSTSMCISCPDVNHVTIKVPATSVEHCVCASGFTTDRNKCEVITCPKLRVPDNGYLVKASACSNVVHAACGIRCRIGFYLTGDSIRLCGKDGNWSGNEPKCLLKTCPSIRPPAHGRIRCQNEEDEYLITENSTAYPIDTRCQFKCETGYQLRGSKFRNCLPLSQWDGLKATCKAIKCEPLKKITNGEVFPEICSGPEKIPFSTNCTIICKKGFVLEGPKIKFCGGRSGVWSQRRAINRCIDGTPPSITCPSDVITENLPGKNYAYVNWTIPTVTDNVDELPILWSKPYINFPWRVKIGTRTVVYVAQDLSGNKARCKFKVKVLDTEPPMIENCINPPTLFTDNGHGLSNISWSEPGFYDNSKTPVRVEQSHRPGANTFPIGLTKVFYNATDKYDNKAVCVLNITVKDICEEVTNVLHGYSKCTSSLENVTKECTVACEEGFGFAVDDPNVRIVEDILLLKCTGNSSNWTTDSYIPDCSETTFPKSVSQEGSIVLEGNETNVCDNETTLRELSEYITADLRSTLLDICGNDIECNLITFDPECEQSLLQMDTVYTNSLRRRREHRCSGDVTKLELFTNRVTWNRSKRHDNVNNDRDKVKLKKKKEKIGIKFKFLAKIIEENIENPREGVEKLRTKIESLSQSGKLNLLDNRTNQEIAKLALNLHLVFKNFEELCDPGSVLKKHTCVKCPFGTFFNSTVKQCQSCPIGEYEDTSGSLKCKRCPEHTSTRKIHSKSSRDCIHLCKPGHYSHKKRPRNAQFALEPCLSCDIGFYQSEFGQTQCLSCPINTTTNDRGTKSINDCLSDNIERNMCNAKSCLNDGQCVEEEDSFSCECLDYYIGSKCETFRNPCDSSPCLNEGTCNVQSFPNSTISYGCTCKYGYSGNNCETYLDECTINPCQNNGTCVSTENDYTCECKDGFEGEFCEIAINHCDPSPCMDGSTCRVINHTWKCFCKPGYLGRYCNLLPCDWLPCSGNSYCVNIEEENATITSYRCECIDGYTGANCTIKVDYCESEPCLNNGICRNGVSNYTCTCPVPYTGRVCETGKYKLSSDYVIHFTKSGTTDYVSIKIAVENLSQLTACLWLQSKDTFNYGTVLSYATRLYDNAFTLTDYNGLVIYVNGQKIVTDIKVNDGHWHFVCFTWEAEDGFWNIFIDGILRDNGTHLARRTFVQGNGTLVIGQEQDRMGGGFSESESYLGKLTLLDIWSTVLAAADVNRLFNTCEKYHGDVIAWSQVQEHVHGDVAILSSPFCRGCPLPVVPFKGNINVSEDASQITYYCENGYVVRFHGKEYRSLNLKCLKQGQWEGYYTPICTRRRCGFPGYFPRGRIHGRSYLFGDKIHYSCLPGYELRGSPRRVCNADGKWSGLPPICIGKTCKNLLAPEHGDIEYVIEEYERDDLSILQVGQQIEFMCDHGFRLIGEKYLTCMETGLWDHERPTCIAYGCPPPKQIEHGYIISASSNNLHETSDINLNVETTNDTFKKIYDFNNVVGYSCYTGYKFRGNNNLLSEFKLQCTENGTWSGFVPDCIPLKCSWPTFVNNSRLLVKTKDNNTIELLQRKVSSNDTNTENTSIENQDVENQFVPGSHILIQCNDGYKLVGNGVRICTNNEEWSSSTTYCEPQECFILNHPFFQILNRTSSLDNHTNIWKNNKTEEVHGEEEYNGFYKNIQYIVEGHTYKKKIVLSCKNHGEMKLNNENIHKFVSNLTWFCNKHAQWEITDLQLNDTIITALFNNEIDNICQKSMCDVITIPGQSYIVEKNYSRSINSTITFKCKQGYILKGKEKSVCLPNNTWSAIPSCKPVTCGKPPKLTNAVLKGNHIETVNFTFGNTITYECIPGHVMFGQSNVKCLANGKWSKIYNRCSRLSCNKPKLPPGATIHGRSYLYQDQLTYICPDGKKQGLITCKADGHWSDLPTCNG